MKESILKCVNRLHQHSQKQSPLAPHYSLFSILYSFIKEANECNYWTCLLRDSDYISQTTATDLLTDDDEIIKMLTASINTAKNNLH